jgi:hypothetical protein
VNNGALKSLSIQINIGLMQAGKTFDLSICERESSFEIHNRALRHRWSGIMARERIGRYHFQEGET